ncbi:MAG: GGDEF domain-containing protein [Erysipelotrichia bacterium]|nr:GGDEF domain-containing protein [Erysipelotrichia bacterium]
MHKRWNVLIYTHMKRFGMLKDLFDEHAMNCIIYHKNETLHNAIIRTEAHAIIMDVTYENISEIVQLREYFNKEELIIIGFLKQKSPGDIKQLFDAGVDDLVDTINELFAIRLVKNMRYAEFVRETIKHSQTDYLTNLYNRRSFNELAEKICSIAKYENSKMCCAMIDIDHFKKINDTYGHLVGDDVIQKVSSVIKTHFRKNDLVGRYGGEEFVVLLREISSEKAHEIFESLRIKINELVIHSLNLFVQVGISIGVYVGYEYSLKSLVGLADNLLYEAKAGGRNKIVLQ